MEQILLFDTSLGTKNQGDYVIKEAIDREMSYLFRDNVVLRVPTHYPVGRGYQVLFGDIGQSVANSEIKFLCGTNIFKYNICRPNRDWNIGVIDQRLYRSSISLGCGVEMNAAKMTHLSKALYRGILSKD